MTVPVHDVAPVIHSQPTRAEHAVSVVWLAQGGGVPLQVDVVHEQSYSAVHAVWVVFAVQGVMVPEHVPVPDHSQ